MLRSADIQPQELAASPWIAPQVGTVLRHRFDLMFRDAGCQSPTHVIEAVSPMVVARLLGETDHLAVLAREVADYFVALGIISILPVTLSFNMDSFGIITRKDWELSPAACVVCEAIEEAAASRATLAPARSTITAA